MKKFFLLTFVLTALPFAWTRAAVDPNFYIFLCFGQSNVSDNQTWRVPLNLRLRI